MMRGTRFLSVRPGSLRVGANRASGLALPVALALGSMASTFGWSALPCAGQEPYQPGQPEYGLVEKVELVAPRIDGPQALILFTAKSRLQPAAGVYVSQEQRALTVKDGRIVGLADPTSRLGRFEVASMDQVMVRHGAPARLYLKDARGRSVPLPDGRYTSREGMTLLVREGMIVAYGKSR